MVRKEQLENAYWFAPFSRETCWFDPEIRKAGKHRSNRASKDLKEFITASGHKYHSPHKFRHGNAVESIKRCKTVTELKAISQNLMHSNLSITDGVYGILSKNDVKEIITGLGK